MGTIKITADVFIIPNKIGCINNNLMESQREKERKLFNEIFKINGIEKTIDPDNDRLVQIWYVGTGDTKSDNIVDHGVMVTYDNGVKDFIRPRIEVLPASLFCGLNEGESVNFKVPYKDDILDLYLTARQLPYRYGHRGPFEELFDVITDCKVNSCKIKNGVLKCKADGFVVPNHADTISDDSFWINSRNFISYLNRVCELNGYSSIDIYSDKIVDIWMTSKDNLKSGNLSDHGATIIGDDGNPKLIELYSIHWIPEKILYGRREGDTFTFKAPFNPDDFHHPETGDVVIEMQLTLAQSKYRYERFGKFQDALKYVCR